MNENHFWSLIRIATLVALLLIYTFSIGLALYFLVRNLPLSQALLA